MDSPKVKTDSLIEKLIPIINELFGIDVLKIIEDGIARYKRDEHQAVNTGITARTEEKLKTIICPRIPLWISPDMLSFIGIVGVIITTFGYLYGDNNRIFLVLVIVGLVINWFGDSFDGSIARYRNRTRPNCGYYIDHFLDSIAVAIFGIGIGASNFVRFELAMIFVIIYLILSTHVLIINSLQKVFKYSFGAFGPTEIRLIGIIVVIYQFFSPIHNFSYKGITFSQYDIALLVVTVVMFLIMIVNFYTKARELHKIDTASWKK